jgi:uncharacterized membrane protein
VERAELVTPTVSDDNTVELGLVVTPALDQDAVDKLADELGKLLEDRYPGVDWHITAVRDMLLTPPAALVDVVDAARSRMLEKDWDLVAYVTELPLRVSRRPLLTHSSPTHGVALISLPALGPWQGRRLVDSVADALGVIAGDTAEDRAANEPRNRRLIARRLAELADDVDDAERLEGVALLHRVVTGNLRLLAGMVRANHPWRLTTRLSGAMIGAIGASAFAVVTSDVWRIAASLSAIRLAAICLGTICGALWTLVGAHHLWERALDSRVREQAMMFNIVTLITIGFGILALYVAVCVLSLAAALVTIVPSVMTKQLGYHSNFGDYVRLALLASALATIGGALGGALESDAAVREATYAYRRDPS